ncbi:hypothetical protein CBM2634_B70026 [Cupriavidus taiwanensis]|uniref:Uncharacterized protein n=1 Tax=Cupriavidus taiwanensis TaxID=164546 RepID=A0A375JEA8_9BURK|nr:hypothetical protein CBM2634_B70026 [Cupriavidus taiwanensis]
MPAFVLMVTKPDVHGLRERCKVCHKHGQWPVARGGEARVKISQKLTATAGVNAAGRQHRNIRCIDASVVNSDSTIAVI